MSTDSNSPLYWLPLTWSWPGPPVWRCSRYGRPVCPAVAQSVSHPPHHYRDTTTYQVMIFLKRPADLLHGFGEHLIVKVSLLSTFYIISRMSETKPSSELLSAIKTADSTKLKDVTPVENPAAKHDMAMVSMNILFILRFQCSMGE